MRDILYAIEDLEKSVTEYQKLILKAKQGLY